MVATEGEGQPALRVRVEHLLGVSMCPCILGRSFYVKITISLLPTTNSILDRG